MYGPKFKYSGWPADRGYDKVTTEKHIPKALGFEEVGPGDGSDASSLASAETKISYDVSSRMPPESDDHDQSLRESITYRGPVDGYENWKWNRRARRQADLHQMKRRQEMDRELEDEYDRTVSKRPPWRYDGD